MNERQIKILSAIVEEYTKTAVPVGSQSLVNKYVPNVSSATVRNDMTVLEEAGYVYQPHVSSGRIPTDVGYRFYIENSMGECLLDRSEQVRLQKELLQMRAKNVRLARTTAKLLSALSGGVGVSGNVNSEEYYEFGLRRLLKEPESTHNLDDVCRLAEALDMLDEKIDTLMSELPEDETKIFIGSENPINEMSGYAMVVSPYHSPEGEKGVVAVIGPKRMEYAKNKSLIEHIKRFLGRSASTVILLAGGSIHVIIR